MAKRTSGKKAGTRGSSTAKRTKSAKPSASRKRAGATRARKATRKAAPAKKTAPARKAARKKIAARSAAARRASKFTASAKKPSKMAAVATAVRGTVAEAVAVVTRTIKGRTGTDALSLLATDHRRMEDLLRTGEETTDQAVKGRRALLDRLTAELAVHEMIEEQVLYPALQAHPEASDIVLEGFQEHHVADLIVRELHAVSEDSEQWGAKFKVLKENIEHHIEEEEGEMFRTARAVFTQDELEAMGAQMAAMKAQTRTT